MHSLVRPVGGVLVTGASRGIGLATALLMAGRGWRVAVSASRPESLDPARRVFAEAGLQAEFLPLNVEDEATWQEALVVASDRIGPLDALVCNAGISPRRDGKAIPLLETAPEIWRQTLDTNVLGTTNGFVAFARHLRAGGRPGSMVAVSSVAANVGLPFVSSYYAASKAALLGLVRTAAHELGAMGIRVNAVAPGRIDTDMTRAGGAALNENIVPQIALRRLGQPKEVAEVIEFLCSERASYVTGATIDITGGWHPT